MCPQGADPVWAKDMILVLLHRITVYVFPIVERTNSCKTAIKLSESSSSDDIFLDGVNDISYIVVGDVWTGWQAHADLEDRLAHTVHV